MTPFNIKAAEKFMRDNSIMALNIHLSNNEVYHCWIAPFGEFKDKFNWHIHNHDHRGPSKHG